MTKLEEKVIDMWLSGDSLAQIALETSKTIAQIASILQKYDNTIEVKQTKSSSLQHPNYDQERVENILASTSPLSQQDKQYLFKALDHWEHVNNIADEQRDSDVLENVTEELLRIGKRLEKDKKPMLKSVSKNKALQKIKVAQALIQQLQQDPESKLPLSKDKDQQVIELLQRALTDEFQQWDLYYAYKSQLRGMARDSVSDHFADHAEEEASHIEILQRYIVGYNIQPTTERKEIPSLGAHPSMEEIVKLQLHFEKHAVETYRELLTHLEETDPLRIEIENILAQEQEHAHDLELLLEGDK